MNSFLLLCPIILPVIGGLGVFFLKPLKKEKSRNIWVTLIMLLTCIVSVLMSVFAEGDLVLWQITDKIAFKLSCDSITVLFSILMTVIMSLAGIYAFDYMRHENNRGRYFGFYLCVIGVLNGIYIASNLLTMYMFYELMTLLSLPLVLHSLSKEAVKAGMKYLYYSIAGAFLSLISIFYIYRLSATYDFKVGGFLDSELLKGNENALLVFVFLAIIGFGCKAGLFPLHDWLPTAHPVAPAPASAILSGIVTKSGVIAIIRLVYFSVGTQLLTGTWVQYAWCITALFTAFMGSMLAYREKVIKKRLAYSTVSQVSYVLFGLSLMNGIGFTGALMHVVFHSVIKTCLFLVSGVIIHNTNATRVDEVRAIGKRMPWTIGAYSIVSLGLVGIPPFSGFISKWYLATGSLSQGLGILGYIGPAVLLISALLTAGYLFPISIAGFFPGEAGADVKLEKCEPKALSLVPILILAFATLIFGLFPQLIGSHISDIVNMLML